MLFASSGSPPPPAACERRPSSDFPGDVASPKLATRLIPAPADPKTKWRGRVSWRSSAGGSEGEKAPRWCDACPSPVHGDRRRGAPALEVVDHLARQRLPNTGVPLSRFRSVTQLARTTRRAEHNNAGRLPVFGVERDLPDPAAAVAGTAAALLAVQNLPPVHLSHLTWLALGQQAGSGGHVRQGRALLHDQPNQAVFDCLGAASERLITAARRWISARLVARFAWPRSPSVLQYRATATCSRASSSCSSAERPRPAAPRSSCTLLLPVDSDLHAYRIYVARGEVFTEHKQVLRGADERAPPRPP